MPQAFWDDNLSAQDKLPLKDLKGLKDYEVKDYQVLDSNSNDITSQEGTGDNVQQPPRPPGMHITTGHKNYDYDNRTYQLLPSRPYNIDPIEHQQAMI
jgi:hypothetical protein